MDRRGRRKTVSKRLNGMVSVRRGARVRDSNLFLSKPMLSYSTEFKWMLGMKPPGSVQRRTLFNPIPSHLIMFLPVDMIGPSWDSWGVGFESDRGIESELIDVVKE